MPVLSQDPAAESNNRQRQLPMAFDAGSDVGARGLSGLSEFTIIDSDLHKMAARFPEPLHSRPSVPERASKVAKRQAIDTTSSGAGIVSL